MKYLSFILIATLFGCNSVEEKVKEKSTKLPYYSSAAFTPEWYATNDVALKAVHTIPAFSFINQEGETITNTTFENKIYIANFFFTTCPGICKNLTANLKLIQKAFEKDNRVLLLSHSVMPLTDNVEKLKKYALENEIVSGKWHLVTGDKEAIYTIARNAYFADEDLGKQLTVNDFLHTENVLLIDKHKRIRGVYKGISTIEMENLIKDIQLLKMEE
jgi:protein SCO1/2